MRLIILAAAVILAMAACVAVTRADSTAQSSPPLYQMEPATWDSFVHVSRFYDKERGVACWVAYLRLNGTAPSISCVKDHLAQMVWEPENGVAKWEFKP